MFSRNFEDQANYYPQLKSKIEKDILGKKSESILKNFIADGEICCFSKTLKKYSDFQELRKKIDDPDKEYFIVLFDLVYFNDQNLSKENIEIRKINLIKFFSKLSKIIFVEKGEKVNFHKEGTIEKITRLFNEAKKTNCEGLVLKETGEKSTYNFGKRQWYKLKSLDEKNCETFDLVPIGGFTGTGKHAHRLSSFLMASFDKENNRFVSLCKLGTGFSEDILDKLTKQLLQKKLMKVPKNFEIPASLKPDFVFKPTEVWEVGYDSITISASYPLGRGLIDEEKTNCGLSLRFPRFCRFRPDKYIEMANSPEDIISLFNKTRSNSNNNNNL